jgi:hypothetical protein
LPPYLPAGFPDEAQRVRARYAAVFQQRLDGALLDIEIGLGGRNAIAVEPMVLNHFRIDNSVVGAINTGKVNRRKPDQSSTTPDAMRPETPSRL